MILEFGFKNFFSFREGAQISFRLDGKVPKAISGDRDFTTVLGIKGANASGKTHVLKALTFIATFARWSFASGESENPVITFNNFYDSDEPSEFFIEMKIGKAKYRYELVATDLKVLRETIFTYGPKKKKYLERFGNEIVVRPETSVALESIRLRDHVSVISTIAQHSTDLLKDINRFFEIIHSNVSYVGLNERPANISDIAKQLKRNPALAKFVFDFIKEADAGICGIENFESVQPDGSTKYTPYFVHQVGDKRHLIHSFAESSGTKALYCLLPGFKRTLEQGGVSIVDEIDVHLHALLLPRLIDLFLNEESNPLGAQLIFSTHDSLVIDLLGRYRTYLVNKEENESFVYRLDDIPGDILRNDRPISPVYLEGRIGGVPKV